MESIYSNLAESVNVQVWARRWRRARCWAPWGPPPSPRAPLPVTCTLHCGSTGVIDPLNYLTSDRFHMNMGLSGGGPWCCWKSPGQGTGVVYPEKQEEAAAMQGRHPGTETGTFPPSGGGRGGPDGDGGPPGLVPSGLETGWRCWCPLPGILVRALPDRPQRA